MYDSLKDKQVDDMLLEMEKPLTLKEWYEYESNFPKLVYISDGYLTIADGYNGKSFDLACGARGVTIDDLRLATKEELLSLYLKEDDK